jgi:hypothetical protein
MSVPAGMTLDRDVIAIEGEGVDAQAAAATGHRNANARHPDVLAAQRRGHAKVRSQRNNAGATLAKAA